MSQLSSVCYWDGGMAGLGRTAVRPLYGLVIGKRTYSRAKREGGILYELSKGWAV